VNTRHVVPVHDMAGVPVEVLTDRHVVSYTPSGTFLAPLAGWHTSCGGRMRS
jgi:hypothetical protein